MSLSKLDLRFISTSRPLGTSLPLFDPNMSFVKIADTGGPNGLRTFGYIVAIVILIFLLLYLGACCYDGLPLCRNHPRRSSGQNAHHGPTVFTPDGRGHSVRDEPRMSDIRFTSWYPLCPQFESQSGRLKLIQGIGESGKRVTDSPANDRGGRGSGRNS